MKLSEKIHGFVIQALEGTDKFLVDFIAKQDNRFLIFIDGDHGITIEDCRELNRKIEAGFDREAEDYELTVSSSGIDQPLKFERQYIKNIGKTLNLVMQDGTRIDGLLVRVGDGVIELEHPVKNTKKEAIKPNSVIPFTEIKKAEILITFGK